MTLCCYHVLAADQQVISGGKLSEIAISNSSNPSSDLLEPVGRREQHVPSVQSFAVLST